MTPDSAYLLNANDTADHPDSTQNAVDGDAKTKWSTGTYSPGALTHPVGIWVDAGSNVAYSQLGILASGSPYAVEVFGSDASSAPSSPPTQAGSGWTNLTPGGSQSVSGKTKVNLKYPSGYQPRYYLIWITSLSGSSATIADTALLG